MGRNLGLVKAELSRFLRSQSPGSGESFLHTLLLRKFFADRAGTLLEVGNIVLNGVMGSIGNLLKTRFTFAVPDFMEDTVEKIMSIHGKDTDSALVAWAKFHVKFHKIEGRIVLIFEQRLLPKLVAAIEALE